MLLPVVRREQFTKMIAAKQCFVGSIMSCSQNPQKKQLLNLQSKAVVSQFSSFVSTFLFILCTNSTQTHSYIQRNTKLFMYKSWPDKRYLLYLLLQLLVACFHKFITTGNSRVQFILPVLVLKGVNKLFWSGKCCFVYDTQFLKKCCFFYWTEKGQIKGV